MKKVIVGLVVVLVLAAGAFALTRSSNNTYETQSSSSHATMNRNKSRSTNSNAPSTPTNVVKIADFAFSPAHITVKKGTLVTWTNNDSTAHTITESDDQNGPKSASLDPGQSYSFTFNSIGKFQYYCSIHPSMTGSVSVTE